MRKQLVENYLDRLWNQRDLSVIEEVFSPDAQIRSTFQTFHSADGMRTVVEKWLARFPDLRVEILHLFEEGERVVCYWRAKSAQLDYEGVTLHRIKGGKICEYAAFVDQMGNI